MLTVLPRPNNIPDLCVNRVAYNGHSGALPLQLYRLVRYSTITVHLDATPLLPCNCRLILDVRQTHVSLNVILAYNRCTLPRALTVTIPARGDPARLNARSVSKPQL